jgi:hypothetical protein
VQRTGTFEFDIKLSHFQFLSRNQQYQVKIKYFQADYKSPTHSAKTEEKEKLIIFHLTKMYLKDDQRETNFSFASNIFD